MTKLGAAGSGRIGNGNVWHARHASGVLYVEGRNTASLRHLGGPRSRLRMRMSEHGKVAIAGLCAVAIVGGAALYGVGRVTGPDGGDSAALASAQASEPESAGSTKTAQAVPAVAQSPTMTALSGVNALDGSAQISTSGFVLGTDLQMQLEQELNIFASYGYSASFTLVDTTTGAALSSYGDTARYSASAIKGPYVLSLAATGTIDLDSVYQAADYADSNTQQLIDQTITVSDNDAYQTLYDAYQSAPFAQWLANAGINADVTTGEYLYLSTNDLARMWAQGYGYLFDGQADGAAGSAAAANAENGTTGSDNTGAETAETAATTTVASQEARQWLASEYSDTLNSSIHMALGNQYSVYSKAGWIGGEGGYYALNDAGIVSSGSGDYVLAVMTDACGEYGLLTDLISLLDTIHSSVMSA